VKELRDVLQTAEMKDDEAFVEALGKSKDAIGEWHDWEELIGIAEVGRGQDCQLMSELKRISRRGPRRDEFAPQQVRAARQIAVQSCCAPDAPSATACSENCSGNRQLIFTGLAGLLRGPKLS
jgi:hypothetical protein